MSKIHPLVFISNKRTYSNLDEISYQEISQDIKGFDSEFIEHLNCKIPIHVNYPLGIDIYMYLYSLYLKNFTKLWYRYKESGIILNGYSDLCMFRDEGKINLFIGTTFSQYFYDVRNHEISYITDLGELKRSEYQNIFSLIEGSKFSVT